jgi:hypothetical protein
VGLEGRSLTAGHRRGVWTATSDTNGERAARDLQSDWPGEAEYMQPKAYLATCSPALRIIPCSIPAQKGHLSLTIEHMRFLVFAAVETVEACGGERQRRGSI